ncbi:MAG: lytic murein transglycosylase [Desulfarculaceae bacterium]|nr:lytic murein transglycosylase [Desulfarculaceae bacterium]MCF8073488.1 lytic murein transglycosylase [Desulfarculaceae bacterium]MCF8100365.1 lytic murein transglycosylase [Desulfarculaceae bacterium]MCF8115899.1 lytic murein transglycosylase [Desulfarculaceae bacterium]
MLALCLLMAAAPGWAATSVFDPLRGELIEQGYSPSQVDGLLTAKGVRFESKLMAALLAPRESSLNYGQFLGKKPVAAGKRFMKKYAHSLAKASAESKVPGEVVVAILTVESRLGYYVGRWSAFNVLASQAVLDTPEAQRLLAKRWPKKKRAQLDTAKTQRRFAKRAAWARRELGSLLKLAKKEGRSPLSYKGSVAGAMGMAQFMPSSLLRWGKDGNNDGNLDLTHPVDAIFSVANYLKAHGWKPGLSYQRKFKVILTYNNSKPYAKTVLALAARLR